MKYLSQIPLNKTYFITKTRNRKFQSRLALNKQQLPGGAHSLLADFCGLCPSSLRPQPQPHSPHAAAPSSPQPQLRMLASSKSPKKLRFTLHKFSGHFFTWFSSSMGLCKGAKRKQKRRPLQPRRTHQTWLLHTSLPEPDKVSPSWANAVYQRIEKRPIWKIFATYSEFVYFFATGTSSWTQRGLAKKLEIIIFRGF